jgi:hypothetical protein
MAPRKARTACPISGFSLVGTADRRLRELLAEGKTRAQAETIIEDEFLRGKGV